VAVQNDSRSARRVLAIGAEAKKMLGRTPGLIVEITENLLRYFIQKIHRRKILVRLRIEICMGRAA
jgi:rod shape-determining protein MreB and related proteins